MLFADLDMELEPLKGPADAVVKHLLSAKQQAGCEPEDVAPVLALQAVVSCM